METSAIRFWPQIAGAARAHGLDPALLAAVAAQETGGPGTNSGANVIGDGGHGRGLFQLDDRYQAFAKTPAALDPAKNADYAAGLISSLLARYGGNVRSALSAYNAGAPGATGTITTWADGARLGYADSVLRHLANLNTRDSLLADAKAPGRSLHSAAAASTPTSAGAVFAPQVQLPAFAPSTQTFRSYQSELQNGGGDIAARTDRDIAAALDPSSALDASDDHIST